MVVVGKRKTTLRHLAARCVVLGDKQVGKSAAIVRFTTGRFIQEYSGSTNDWLYRHSLGFDAKKNATTSLELLEQKDIQFCSSSNFFATSTNTTNNNNNNNTNHQSLASRVALDQQIDNELHEKQQLLKKLHWADAYIVIYAVNDISTFNKAIKYLNLIANTINSPSDNHKRQQNGATSSGSSGTGSSQASQHGSNSNGNCSNSSSVSSNLNNLGSITSSGGNKLLNRLSPSYHSQHSHSNSTGSIYNGCTNKIISPINLHSGNRSGSVFCSCNPTPNGNIKRPILLLANKSDLGRTGRQVSAADGRLLAIRHQSMFAEVSVAESHKLIENVVNSLIEQIDPACLHVDYYMSQQNQSEIHSNNNNNNNHHQRIVQDSFQPKLVQWIPTLELALNQTNIGLMAPVWGNIVKSQVIGSNVAQSSCVKVSASKTKALESDVRLITPLGSSKVKTSVDAKGPLPKPMKAGAVLGSSLDRTEAKSLTLQKPINNRYENLKSSFRRASMAIVSSRALAKGSQVAKVLRESDIKSNKVCAIPASVVTIPHPQITPELEVIAPKAQVVQSLSAKKTDEMNSKGARKLSSSTTGCSKPANWFKNHIKGLHRAANSASCSDEKLNTTPAASTTSVVSQAGEKVKRPLLRYKNRRKTVAFEQIGQEVGIVNPSSIEIVSKPATIEYLPPTDNVGIQALEMLEKRRSEGSSRSSGSYNSIGCSSGRSSSSLSTTDPYFSALFVLWNAERTPSSVGSVCSSNYSGQSPSQIKVLKRANSKSTLSRTSTSGESYEDSADELTTKTDTKSSIAREQSATQLDYPPAARLAFPDNKKRNHLVKSVQSTLTNLAKSSNVSTLAAKRSFCNALFPKHPATNAIVVSTKPLLEQAKIETIQARPACFCN